MGHLLLARRRYSFYFDKFHDLVDLFLFSVVIPSLRTRLIESNFRYDLKLGIICYHQSVRFENLPIFQLFCCA